MKNTQANTQIENANVIATELRNATSNAYFGYLNFNETDIENLIKVSQVDNKTIIRHTVQIPGIPTNTSIRFEINQDGKGLHYNIVGHHNKLQYIRRTDNIEAAKRHYANTLYEIVHYCFVPPPSLNSRWL
jgi:hypothetical protein